MQTAGKNTDEWLTYSGSYDGWRHTSLAEITPANVAQLRARWIKQFDISQQNIEATPLVVDGVIFFAADAGNVLALNAKTGDVISIQATYSGRLAASIRTGESRADGKRG